MEDGIAIVADNTGDVFHFASLSLGLPEEPSKHQAHLTLLRTSVRTKQARQTIPDGEWVELVSTELRSRLNKRLDHVTEWVDINTTHFGDNKETQKLRRILESALVDIRASVEFCRLTCTKCKLLCLLPRHHQCPHHCTTSHRCRFKCAILDGHCDSDEPCGRLSVDVACMLSRTDGAFQGRPLWRSHVCTYFPPFLGVLL